MRERNNLNKISHDVRSDNHLSFRKGNDGEIYNVKKNHK